jgi:integrase
LVVNGVSAVPERTQKAATKDEIDTAATLLRERLEMAGTVNHAKLGSPTARERLKRGRQPHWQALVEGKVHLGYQCWKAKPGEGKPLGRWLLRRYIGNNKYRVETLGRADDAARADDVTVLSFDQAQAKARAMVASPGGGNGKIERLTVRQAMERYIEFKRHKGQSVRDVTSRSGVHILPALGNLVVSDLSADTLRRWLSNMANSPAQLRSKGNKPNYRAAPVTKEDVRRRKASANRVLTMLKAALNHAYDEGHVQKRDAWGRRLAPFEKVEVARVRYLTVAEAERLINACEPNFRALVRAGLETGCRYGELTQLEVCDFNPDAKTLAIRQSKSGEPRHVVLTEEGAAFFRRHCAGRDGHKRMFCHDDGGEWQKSEQARPMAEACIHAKIKPAISFHILRHTWASLAVMEGVPLMVVAKNLGHADTRMVEKHYGHLAPSFIADAIRAGAPRYRVKEDKGVVPLR